MFAVTNFWHHEAKSCMRLAFDRSTRRKTSCSASSAGDTPLHVMLSQLSKWSSAPLINSAFMVEKLMAWDFRAPLNAADASCVDVIRLTAGQSNTETAENFSRYPVFNVK